MRLLREESCGGFGDLLEDAGLPSLPKIRPSAGCGGHSTSGHANSTKPAEYHLRRTFLHKVDGDQVLESNRVRQEIAPSEGYEEPLPVVELVGERPRSSGIWRRLRRTKRR